MRMPVKAKNIYPRAGFWAGIMSLRGSLLQQHPGTLLQNAFRKHTAAEGLCSAKPRSSPVTASAAAEVALPKSIPETGTTSVLLLLRASGKVLQQSTVSFKRAAEPSTHFKDGPRCGAATRGVAAQRGPKPWRRPVQRGRRRGWTREGAAEGHRRCTPAATGPHL